MRTTFDINKVIRPNIAKLKAYSSARDEFKDFDQEMIFLDANENPYESGVNRYPDPLQRKLKTVLSEMKGVSEKNMVLGNGSDEVLDLLFRAFCEPKVDNVLLLPPTYGMYQVLAETNNVNFKEVLLDTDFQPRVEQILEEADNNTKMIFLCSPNNPTGNSFEKDKVIEILENFNGVVVIDEAYIDFSHKKSWLELLSFYPNLVIVQTLSKAYGLAGIRLGICYASKEIITFLNKIKPPYNVNELTQLKALERLDSITNVHNEIRNILLERERLRKTLSQVSFVETVYPSEANFILAKVDDASKRYEQLLKNGIVTRNRTSQPMCKNTLRFTIGTMKENKRLIEILNDLNKL